MPVRASPDASRLGDDADASIALPKTRAVRPSATAALRRNAALRRPKVVIRRTHAAAAQVGALYRVALRRAGERHTDGVDSIARRLHWPRRARPHWADRAAGPEGLATPSRRRS